MAKMVNATFASQNQGVIITRQMWHLPCLPQIYFSIFTNLRHIHWEQILYKSIFSSRDATSFLATCRAITPFSGYCLCTFCSIALFSFLLYICIYSYSSSTFLEELTCVIILFIFDHFGGTHVLTSYSGPLSKEKVRRQSHKSQGFYFVYRTQ